MIQWTSLTDIFSQMETKFTCVPGKSSVGRSFNDCIWIQSSLFFEQVVNPNSESLPIRRNWKRSVSNKGFATQRCLPVTALQAFHGSLATRFSPMLGSYCEDYWLHSGRETQAWCSGLLFFHTSVYKLESTHGWWWWKKLFPLVSFFSLWFDFNFDNKSITVHKPPTFLARNWCKPTVKALQSMS